MRRTYARSCRKTVRYLCVVGRRTNRHRAGESLVDGSLGFGGEKSAGATFLRRDGTVWTTDKDDIVPALISAEITAPRRDPEQL